MKKIVKTIAAFGAVIPVAAFAACGGLTPVANENKATVYQSYADKTASAVKALTTGETHLNSYLSAMFETTAGEDCANFAIRYDIDTDLTDAIATRMAFVMDGSLASNVGGQETTMAGSLKTYLTDDGRYDFSSTTNNGTTAEEKSFTPKENLSQAGITLGDVIFLPSAFNSTPEEFMATYAAAEWSQKEDGTKIQIKATHENWMPTGGDWNDTFFLLMLSSMGTQDYTATVTETITLTFDRHGNLLFLEQDFSARVTPKAQTEATAAELPEEEGTLDEGEAGGENEGEAGGENEGEAGGGETPAPAPAKVSAVYRYTIKISVKSSSTVKLPTAAKLDECKAPASGGEESNS